MSFVFFSSACKKPRPIRLNETLREWAWESLQGRYGDEALQNDCVSMDDIEGFDTLSKIDRHDMAIRRIAETAPLRCIPGESVSGSATLGLAFTEHVPARYHGEAILNSVSHLTIDFESVVRDGIDVRQTLVRTRLADLTLTDDQRRFYESADSCFESMRIYHRRYLELLEKSAPENAERLKYVPFGPARSFREALQSIWFTFSFVRLCGNWPGIGRLDKILAPFLEQELADGTLTLDEAREFLAGFFIKGCEWVRTSGNPTSGDAQNYQNIVLSGIDENGEQISSVATNLILDIVEELPIGDFPITIRLSERTPDSVKEKAAHVIRHGSGVIALYNENLILNALTDFGYPLRDARNFANDGCWEVQIPGKTFFIYMPFDGLKILLSDTLHLDGVPAHFDDIVSLKAAYFANLNNMVKLLYGTIHSWKNAAATENKWIWKKDSPCTIVSMFEEGCLENGRSYWEGGPVYNVIAPHIGGAPDVGNSLYAINQLCFIEKKVSFDDLMRIVKNDWNGEEALRQYALHQYTYYGNDNDESDAYVAEILNTFADQAKALDGLCPIRFPAGVSTFGRQIEWIPGRCATPFGRKSGDILSGNTSPTPGTDMSGATAVIASYCKADLSKQVNGAALDIRLAPSAVSGDNGIEALIALMDGFCALGGYFMQPDVLDAETLRKAQEDPEAYRTLSVRVSGWNARFVTLDQCWQQMVIERTEHGI